MRLIVIGLCLAALPAGAQPREIVRLPPDVHASRERVELEVDPDKETFSGRVEIALTLDRPRDDLLVSARGLTLETGTLTAGSERLEVTFQPDDARGAARVVLPRRLPAGKATLAIAFHAAYNPILVGLYRVEERGRWYAYTQLEAIDARRAFPCLDEPTQKIPWEVVLTVPRAMTAVSNAAQAEETVTGDRKRVVFRPTRPLPSYLVAIAVGDFDVVSQTLPPNDVRARSLPVRGIAPKGRGPELAFALRAGAEMLVMLEHWFGTEYPYEKLDHVAVPDFAFGAMENAGLITYREQALLVDPRFAAEDQKLNVAADLAHEMAHQWFGDLVTMAWWDDLWLNESFATMVETDITPKWSPASGYDLDRLRATHWAMTTDEGARVTPVHRDVATEADIFGIDYAIDYPKGAQVLSMFRHFMGVEAFRAGIQRYLLAHADGNATMDDLLAALSAQRPGVGDALRTFVTQPGVPMVAMALRCDGAAGPRVTLRQERDVPLGMPAQRDVVWKLPVCVRAAGAAAPVCALLTDAQGELALGGKACPAWIMPNPEANGYYRFILPPAQLRDLVARGYPRLSPAERMALGDSLVAAYDTGALPGGDVLALIDRLARDPEPKVAQLPAGLYTFVRDYVVEPGQRDAVDAHVRALYAPALARVGWKARRGEPAKLQAFRGWLVDQLALAFHDPAVLARAAALGRAYLGDDGRMHPEAVDANLADVSLEAAARLGPPALFATLLERLGGEEDGNVRRRLLVALGNVPGDEQAEKARALAFDDRLHVNERSTVVEDQNRWLELRPGAVAWVRAHFDELAARLPAAYVNGLIAIDDGCSDEAAAKLERLLAPRVASYDAGAYTLGKQVDAIRRCAAVVAAQRESTAAFFRGRRPK